MANIKEIIGEELYKQLPEDKKKEFKEKDLEDISNGAYIPKERFNQVNEQAKEYKKQVGERNTQIKDLKEEFKDATGLKEKVEELEADNTKKDKEYEAKITEITMNNAIEKALGAYKCKNTKLVKALIDDEKLKVDGDSIIGLKEQMETIQKENEFLFEKEVAGSPDFILNDHSNDKGNGGEKKSFGEKLADEKISEMKNSEKLDGFFK
ncbi:phage scaffolding protein [Clostridium sp. HBUAS56017]|uniref:phage scaffolding protein n=1 Tax=Clostridium sp. HBUAS56017 TaxID=2571128 RepID=UPI0011781835|nr:phage scaffolding protein [Clostridium sp. HBUAS56017]